MQTQHDNFLEYTFAIKKGLTWTQNDDGLVTVRVENKGFTNRLAQKFFDKPAVSYIDLPGIGSFVFACIDGKRTVYEIGQLVQAQFGKDAEPLYERISVFMKQLEQQDWIERV